MSESDQFWHAYDDRNAVTIPRLDDHGHPSQATSESIDATSWVNEYMEREEFVPMNDETEHPEGLIVASMPTNIPPSTSSSMSSYTATPRDSALRFAPVWPQTLPQQLHFLQQHTLPSPLQSNPGVCRSVEAQYQESTFEPDRYGLGIESPSGYRVYAMEPDGSINPALVDGQLKVEHDDESGGLPNPQHHIQHTPVPEPDCDSETGRDDKVVKKYEGPYNNLLYICLKQAKGRTMSLKDIYEWIKRHTEKATDPSEKGWQNSVRHNLSMNAAFVKVPSSADHGGKKGGAGLWRLTDDALERGRAISTTRYRKASKHKQERRIGGPAPKRQDAGSKGGKATRDAGRHNRQMSQRTKFAHATSAPRQHHSDQYYYNNRLMDPSILTSTPSAPAMKSTRMLGAPLPSFLQHDRPSPLSPLPMQFQRLTPMSPLMSPSMPLHMMVDHPVSPASAQWEFADIDPTNGGIIANYDLERRYPGSTPGLTSDSSPFLESVDSFQSFSREPSVTT